MTIQWDFATETVTRTDQDGNQTTSERRGDLRDWCHYSDPVFDAPDQRIDWRAEGLSVSTPSVPEIVKTHAITSEVDAILAASDPDLEKAIRVLRDAAGENIEKR
jgi:hypothetical protein